MVRAFPGEVRFTGVSFSYNVAYAVFGGLTPMAVGTLAGFNAMGPAHYVALVVVIGLIAVVANGMRRAAVYAPPVAAE